MKKTICYRSFFFNPNSRFLSPGRLWLSLLLIRSVRHMGGGGGDSQSNYFSHFFASNAFFFPVSLVGWWGETVMWRFVHKDTAEEMMWCPGWNELEVKGWEREGTTLSDVCCLFGCVHGIWFSHHALLFYIHIPSKPTVDNVHIWTNWIKTRVISLV